MDPETGRLLQQLRNLDRNSLPSDDVRVQTLQAAQRLCQRLETPFESIIRMTWQEVSALI